MEANRKHNTHSRASVETGGIVGPFRQTEFQTNLPYAELGIKVPLGRPRWEMLV